MVFTSFKYCNQKWFWRLENTILIFNLCYNWHRVERLWYTIDTNWKIGKHNVYQVSALKLTETLRNLTYNTDY